MSIARIDHVAVRGIVSVVPGARWDNLDVPAQERRQRERLVKHVGVRWRHYCGAHGLIFSDLAQRAAEALMQGLGWSSVDALIVVTQSPEFLIPATAVILQHRLGLSTRTMAFDINLGCSGYPYGIYTCAAMVGAQGARRVIVLVGDQAASVGAADAGREILFGDACTATALEYDPAAAPMYFEGCSDGSGYDAIIVPHGGKRYPWRPDSAAPLTCPDGVVRSLDGVWLDGPAILSFSTSRAPEAIRGLIQGIGADADSIDYFVMHQANAMINETIRKKVGGEARKWPSSLYDYGNTSSASIPVTISARLAEQASSSRLRWICCGFGIGLSWGTLFLETEPFYAPQPIALTEKYDFFNDRFS